MIPDFKLCRKKNPTLSLGWFIRLIVDDKKVFVILRHFLNLYCKHFLSSRIIFQPDGQFLTSKFDKHFQRGSARLCLQSVFSSERMFLVKYLLGENNEYSEDQLYRMNSCGCFMEFYFIVEDYI